NGSARQVDERRRRKPRSPAADSLRPAAAAPGPFPGPARWLGSPAPGSTACAGCGLAQRSRLPQPRLLTGISVGKFARGFPPPVTVEPVTKSAHCVVSHRTNPLRTCIEYMQVVALARLTVPVRNSTDCSTATPPCSQAGTSWDWPRRRLRERDRRRTRLRSDRCCYTSTWFARARRIGCKHRPTQGSEPSSFFEARETCMNCVASEAPVHPTLVGSPSHPSAPGR